MKDPAWLASWGAVLLAVLGCKQADTTAERVCIPGLTQQCYGPGRCSGTQSCLASGEGYGPCDCGSLPDAGAPALGPLCTAGELRICSGDGACVGVQECGEDSVFGACDCSGQRLIVSTLGAPCQEDTDCGTELQCWSVTAAAAGAFVGGAAHGYCTRACRVATDCSAFDVAPACSLPGADGNGVCLRGCLSKEPIPNEAKCLDRVDQLCLSSAALGQEPFSTTQRQQGACLPSCGNDADCAPRVCDLASGLCLDQAAPGLGIGAACTTDAECAGALCVELIAGGRFCSAACPLDSLGCGFTSDADPRGAACIGPWLRQDGVTEGRQDLGVCVELCNTASDCTQADWVCDTTGGSPPGAAGTCIPAALQPSSPDADAGVDAGP